MAKVDTESGEHFEALLVLDEFSYRLQRIRLGEGNDANCVPVIPDPQFSTKSPPIPFVVLANGSMDLTLTFKPGSVGTKSSTLTITSDDPDEARFECRNCNVDFHRKCRPALKCAAGHALAKATSS